MVGPSRREKQREATVAEIKAIALRQMAESGAAALSLRGIASEIGMSAPSLYNYYKNRDELVTALIVDAYASLGDATQAASTSLPEEDYGARFLAVSMAFREWGLVHREQFILIYGTPVPGYHAPVEITTPVSIRATNPFISILEQAWRAGRLKVPPEYHGLDSPAHRQVEQSFRKQGVTMPTALLQIVLEGRGMIHGNVSLELYGHYNHLKADMGDLYRAETVAYLRRIGIAPD